MSRTLHLPYKPSNPRTVRGAKRIGWSPVKVGQAVFKDNELVATWMGLCIWAEKHCSGYWVASHQLGTFAFEKPEDASMFLIKWTW